tara:strand:- start:23898 stop:24575 length:678 start_codon:yes stop_codon:yes gene_type:complete
MNIGKKKIIIVSLILVVTQVNMIAQQCTKKILLTKAANQAIQCENLQLTTLLQVYDETAPAHLIGDIYLRVNANDETIAGFYINHDQPKATYDTKIYKNHYLTFRIENDNKYLIIAPAHFGKAFALSSNGIATIGTTADEVVLEITDFYQESGYDGPPEDKDRSSFSDVHYTLKVKVGDVVKNVSFYSSEVNGNYTIDLGNYSITILSDKYKNASSLIEMIVDKK